MKLMVENKWGQISIVSNIRENCVLTPITSTYLYELVFTLTPNVPGF